VNNTGTEKGSITK